MGFKTAREKAGLSVRQVMEAMEVTDVAVYQWESGKNMPKTSSLPKLAKLYGVTVDELLAGEEN